MNSKRKCTNCKQFFPQADMLRGGVSGICSRECEQQLRDKARDKHTRKIERRAASREARRVYSNTGASSQQKRDVRNRDGDRCTRCGTTSFLHVHHINYRSEGGPNSRNNLITLCEDCHEWAHANKRERKPILLAYIWLLYVQGQRYTIPQIQRMLRPNDSGESDGSQGPDGPGFQTS